MELRADDGFLLNLPARGETLFPGRMVPFPYPVGQCLQHPAGIPAKSHIDRDDLADLSLVYIDMDNLGLTGIFVHRTGHTVVEPHSHSYQKVTFTGLYIGCEMSVHAYHPLIAGKISRKGAEPQHRRPGRQVALAEEFRKPVFRMTDRHSLTEDHEGFFRSVDKGRRGIKGGIRRERSRMIAPDPGALFVFEIGQADLRILGEIKYDRARTSARSDIEGPGNSPGHIFRPPDLIVPFRDGTCHAGHVSLLEGVSAEGRV